MEGDGCLAGGEPFVFGNGGGKEFIDEQNIEVRRVERRPVIISNKEKLLALGGLGFLVSHAEEEDIVSEWKGFFAKWNAETIENREKVDEPLKEDDGEDDTMRKYHPRSPRSKRCYLIQQPTTTRRSGDDGGS
ncbi:hypothetical protein K1719_018101 [Acacia pycnantha]|nr:hypothetical protein K1719_018101 [Acacia pycnantha]